MLRIYFLKVGPLPYSFLVPLYHYPKFLAIMQSSSYFRFFEFAIESIYLLATLAPHSFQQNASVTFGALHIFIRRRIFFFLPLWCPISFSLS